MITSEADYIVDLVNNFRGGLHQGTNVLGMGNFKVLFDAHKAGFLKGASLFINAAMTHGAAPSKDLVGDFQGISNIEAGNLIYLHELWYKQQIGRLALSIGLQDLASQFAVSENGAHFLNGSFGIHSTISSNVPSPVFPLTALGLVFTYNISDRFIFRTAAFDGLPDDFNKNPHNLIWDINSSDGIMSISEVDFASQIYSLSGLYKIGAYYHNHVITGKNNEIPFFTDNYGIYFVGDQVIHKNGDNENENVSLFIQLGLAPGSRNDNNYYLGGGFTYQGILKRRANDILGLAIANAGFNNKENETVIELSYKARITENLSLQPDLQYIINPSGTSQKLNNTFTGILRLGFCF